MNQTAFQVFYEQTSSQLWRYLLRICRDAEAAKDILQESYLRFLEKPPASQIFAQRRGYLYAIATRLNMDHLKKERRQNFWRFSFFKIEAPENPRRHTDLRVDMATLFKRLKPQERALLWLAYVEEQPHHAIAGILGLGENSIRVLLYRARQKLMKILKDFEIDEKVMYES